MNDQLTRVQPGTAYVDGVLCNVFEDPALGEGVHWHRSYPDGTPYDPGMSIRCPACNADFSRKFPDAEPLHRGAGVFTVPTREVPMGEPFRFEIKVTAVGEVRDAEGNLISPATAESVREVTESELAELGIPAPHHPNKENKS